MGDRGQADFLGEDTAELRIHLVDEGVAPDEQGPEGGPVWAFRPAIGVGILDLEVPAPFVEAEGPRLGIRTNRTR